LTERRAKITLGWRAGAPTERVDDFDEVPAEPVRTPERRLLPELREERIEERRSIGRRLENWGMWSNLDNRGGGRGNCITGVICENMRKHAAGEIHPPAPVNTRIDVPDAERINSAFLQLPEMHRGVLNWTYVVGAKSWAVAGACGFPTREYDQRLAEAQAAIESVANKNMGRRG
jgi:hypothetical protein